MTRGLPDSCLRNMSAGAAIPTPLNRTPPDDALVNRDELRIARSQIEVKPLKYHVKELDHVMRGDASVFAKATANKSRRICFRLGALRASRDVLVVYPLPSQAKARMTQSRPPNRKQTFSASFCAAPRRDAEAKPCGPQGL